MTSHPSIWKSWTLGCTSAAEVPWLNCADCPLVSRSSQACNLPSSPRTHSLYFRPGNPKTEIGQPLPTQAACCHFSLATHWVVWGFFLVLFCCWVCFFFFQQTITHLACNKLHAFPRSRSQAYCLDSAVSDSLQRQALQRAQLPRQGLAGPDCFGQEPRLTRWAARPRRSQHFVGQEQAGGRVSVEFSSRLLS